MPPSYEPLTGIAVGTEVEPEDLGSVVVAAAETPVTTASRAQRFMIRNCRI